MREQVSKNTTTGAETQLEELKFRVKKEEARVAKERYSIRKPKSGWLVLPMLVGLGLGGFAILMTVLGSKDFQESAWFWILVISSAIHAPATYILITNEGWEKAVSAKRSLAARRAGGRYEELKFGPYSPGEFMTDSTVTY